MHSFGHAYKTDSGYPLTAREKVILDAVKALLSTQSDVNLRHRILDLQEYIEGKRASLDF